MGLLTDRDWLVDFRSNIEVQHASSRVHHKIIRTLNRKLLRQGQKASFYRVKPPSRNTVVGDVRYSVGQPMGLYSSWSSLAWCHHVIVWLAAQRAGRRDPTRFRRYAVLGDDVVIGCPNVAKHYRDIMDSLGVEINLTKSYQMVGVAEFAKSLYVGGNDISPISPSILLLGKEYYHEDTLILLEMLYKRGIRPTLKEFLDILPEKKVYTESVLLVTSPYSPVSFPVGVWGDDFLNPAHTREDLKFYVSFMTFTDRVTNFKKVSRLSRTIHSLRKGCPNFGGFLNPYRNMIHELYHSYRGVMVLELDEIQFTFGMGDNFIFWTSWELEYSYMHVGTEATMPMSDGDIC